RMAELLNDEVGQTIGFRVRFESKVSKATRIEVLTEGILTRLIQEDNSLEGIAAVIFDEFHERSLHADLALALAREVQQVLRPDLKIIIMSATLDMAQLSKVLGQAPILESSGRQYPVDIIYDPIVQEVQVTDKMFKTIQRVVKEQPGDVLAFLPGKGEISRVQQMLEPFATSIEVHTLHGNMTPQEQRMAILPSRTGKKKVVLSTSIAETSLTIEGVRTVIDSGLSRKSQFDPRSGLSKMVTLPITQDAADQRAGRAGRLGPGMCYRLWSSHAHQNLSKHRNPEILEADLAPLTLELANWGQNDVLSMSWLTPPPSGALAQARELLEALHALENGKISEKGKSMVKLATHPRLAHMFLVAQQKGLLPLATDIAAVLEEKDPLYDQQMSTDINLRIELLRRFRNIHTAVRDKGLMLRIERLAQEWRNTFKSQIDNGFVDPYATGFLLACAFPERVGKKKIQKGNQYQLANNRQVLLQDHDPLGAHDWLVIPNLELRNNEGRVFLASPVSSSDLDFLTSHRTSAFWDRNKEQFVAQKEVRLGAIMVSAQPITAVDPSVRVEAICAAIKDDNRLLDFNDDFISLQSRISALGIWEPEGGWPLWQQQNLCNTAEKWLAPYLNDVKNAVDLRRLDIAKILMDSLPWEKQQELEALAPSKIPVPSGSLIALEYKEDGTAPVLAVRLQELFGLLESPTVCNGRIKVLLHLLSPGYKPVQITGDLKSFWSNTYQEVKKELQRRYPKHSWPEDPYTAKAVRGAVRKNK
ncbi:MAG TPA: ATP-dependent helicase HrpB, partial [Cytophagales bacterium]|nr:ATP-dependent helicase HrpB [Cytophagales bacterium]